MTSAINPMIPNAGLAAPGNRLADRQTDADNQRQAWLRQAESNQISLLELADERDKVLPLEAQTKSNSIRDGAPQSFHHRGIPTQGPAQVTLLPVHTISPQSEESGESVAANAPPAGMAPQTGAAPSSTASNPTVASAGAASGKIASQSSLLTTANTVALSESGLPTEQAAAAIPAAAMAQSQATGQAYAQTEESAATPKIESRATTFLALPPESAATPAEEQEEAGEAQHHSAPDTAGSTGGEWQKRLMHVAQDGQDLSVSIRDSALDDRQSIAVVNRLAADAAQAGLNLGSATVNGKTILKQPKSGIGGRQADGKAVAAAISGLAAGMPVAQFHLQDIDDSNTAEEQQHGA